MLRKALMTCLLVALAGATSVAAETVDREFNESFDVEPGVALRLVSGDGDVDIAPWNENRLEVQVRYHSVSRGWGGVKDFEVDFDRSGDTITVEGREIGSNFFVGGTRTHEYRYTIKAPPYVALRIEGDDGDVDIRHWEADIELRINDGDARIDGLDGDLLARLDDGDLELDNCAVGRATVQLEDGDVTLRGGSGDWRLTVDDGDLDLRDLAAGSLEARGQDGDIHVTLTPGPFVEADLASDDGNIDLTLFSGLSARFSIDVDDGSISLHGSELTVESKRDHRTTGRIGDGRGEIRIRTNDGDVRLRAER